MFEVGSVFVPVLVACLASALSAGLLRPDDCLSNFSRVALACVGYTSRTVIGLLLDCKWFGEEALLFLICTY